MHYDTERPPILSCDASLHGTGEVPVHVMPERSEKLVSYASRVLKVKECNYSKIERE